MKIVYDKVDISIAVAATSFSQNKTLKYKGTCKGVKYIDFSSATPRAHAVNLNVSDSSNALIGSTDFRDFIPAGGAYQEGFKACNFDTKTEIVIDAVASQAIATADFKGQLIFMIEEEC